MADAKPMKPAPPTATVGGTPAGSTQVPDYGPVSDPADVPVEAGGAPAEAALVPADAPKGEKYVFVPRDQAIYQGRPFPERAQDVPPVILGGPSPYGTDQNNQPLDREEHERIKAKREALDKGEPVALEDVTVKQPEAPKNPNPPTGPLVSPTAAAPPTGGK